eukprot:2346364-Rhodomonas_salina.3
MNSAELKRSPLTLKPHCSPFTVHDQASPLIAHPFAPLLTAHCSLLTTQPHRTTLTLLTPDTNNPNPRLLRLTTRDP